ncbi:MAG: efflux RND transporter permease subunit [Nitrospirota bacterium]
MAKKLIEFVIKNRWMVICLCIMAIFWGIRIFQTMPIDVYPDIDDPRVTILTEAHGWSPEEVETLITFPLETAFNGAPFVKRVRSSSGIGLSIIFIEFEWGTDIFVARQMVTERLQIVVPNLPKGVDAPVIAPITSRLGEIVEYVLVNNNEEISPLALREIADWIIKFRLQSVPGVANVINQGGVVKQYQVFADPDKLVNFNLSIFDLEEALKKSNMNSPGGFYLSDTQEYLIRGIGRLHDVKDIENVIVATREHNLPVLIKDVAEVKIGGLFLRRRGAGSFNGKETALSKISKQPGTNTISVTEYIKAALNEIKKTLPEGIDIRLEYLQSDLIERAISNVKMAVYQGGFLVALILTLFLSNLRPTLITLTAIPLSLLIAVIGLSIQGLTVNIMTLGGLAIAIGMVVDDAIIDVENTNRRLIEYFISPTGETTGDVNLRASYEMWHPAFFATVIIVLVFIPLLNLSGIEGRLFKPLAYAVIIAMIASLVVSTFVTPALCQIFLASSKKKLKDKEPIVVRYLLKIYRPILNFALTRGGIIIAISVICLLISIGLLSVTGREFLPIMDEGMLVVNIRLVPGTSLQESIRIARRVEERILDLPEVISVTNRTGRAEQDEHAEGVNSNEILARLLPPEDREKSREDVIQDIRAIIKEFPGIVANIGQPIQHRIDHLLSGVNAQLAMKLFGHDLKVLRAKAKEIEKIVSGIEGAADLQIEQQVDIPQLKIDIDQDAASRYGLSSGEIAEFIETAFKGKTISQIISGQRQHDLYLRLNEDSIENIDTIKRLLIKTESGALIPLNQVADIYFDVGPNTINRENVSRRIVIQSNVSNRDIGSFVEEARDKISKGVVLPEGYFITYGGQFESQQRAAKRIFITGAMVIVGIFLLLYTNFSSAKTASLIMLNLPLALIGGVISIFISDGTLSISSLVGFILLFGIAVRNGIVLITSINDIRKEGVPLIDAIKKGCEIRMSPVLMTALTTGFGMLPLALSSGSGAEIQKPLAIVILGGIATSTILTLVVLPCIYQMMEKKE